MRLIRNSEDRNPAGMKGGVRGDRSKAYDPTAWGGTTTLVYDEDRQELLEDFVSLNGTIVNCAGGIVLPRKAGSPARRRSAGPTPPRTCASASSTATCSRPRSTATPASSRWRADRRRGPLRARGGAVDQRTGIVYETEDPGGVGAGFYRYTPDDPRYLLDGRRAAHARHRRASAGRSAREPGPGVPLDVRWVPIETPIPRWRTSGPAQHLQPGLGEGGAKFFRLEGCWEDHSTIYFVSTGGGDVKNGDLTAGFPRASARSGPTGPAAAATARSRSSTSRRPAPRWTRRTT